MAPPQPAHLASSSYSCIISESESHPAFNASSIFTPRKGINRMHADTCPGLWNDNNRRELISSSIPAAFIRSSGKIQYSTSQGIILRQWLPTLETGHSYAVYINFQPAPTIHPPYCGTRGIRCNFASSNFYTSKDNWPIEYSRSQEILPHLVTCRCGDLTVVTLEYQYTYSATILKIARASS
jgi:hypothetical protein